MFFDQINVIKIIKEILFNVVKSCWYQRERVLATARRRRGCVQRPAGPDPAFSYLSNLLRLGRRRERPLLDDFSLMSFSLSNISSLIRFFKSLSLQSSLLRV